jgi:hypothetical protein
MAGVGFGSKWINIGDGFDTTGIDLAMSWQNVGSLTYTLRYVS